MTQSDQLVRFLFREKDVRGEIVKVAASLDLMLQSVSMKRRETLR